MRRGLAVNVHIMPGLLARMQLSRLFRVFSVFVCQSTQNRNLHSPRGISASRFTLSPLRPLSVSARLALCRPFKRVSAYAHVGLLAGNSRPGFRFWDCLSGAHAVAAYLRRVCRLFCFQDSIGYRCRGSPPRLGTVCPPGCLCPFPVGQAHCITGKPIFQLMFTHILVLFLHRFTHILPYFSL